MLPSRNVTTRSAAAATSAIVRHEHDGQAVGSVQVAQHGDDLGAGVRVEVAGRLVGEQQLGLVDERARDRDALLLASRKLTRHVCGARREPDPRQRRAGTRVLRAERPGA